MRKETIHNFHLRAGHAIVTPEHVYTSRTYFPRSYSANLELGRKKNKTNGTLSGQAIKNLKNSISNLISSSTEKKLYSKKFNKYYKFRCSFITLTLSDKQKHSDKEITKLLLKPFIQYLRDAHNVVNYVWKAETQKNGNIHYHLIINKFIHYSLIQNHWNKLQLKHGYLDNYYIKNQHYNAHSTEIKAIKKIRNITGYFIKYLAKNQKDRRCISSKIWGASYNLLKKCDALPIMNKIREEVEYLTNNLSNKVKDYDFFTLILFDHSKLMNFKSLIRDHWINFISKISEPPDEQLIFTI